VLTRVRNIRHTLKMEASCASETFINFYQMPHVVGSQEMVTFVIAAHKSKPLRAYCGLSMDCCGDNFIGIEV
jgi:hypothetical protein